MTSSAIITMNFYIQGEIFFVTSIPLNKLFSYFNIASELTSYSYTSKSNDYQRYLFHFRIYYCRSYFFIAIQQHDVTDVNAYEENTTVLFNNNFLSVIIA